MNKLFELGQTVATPAAVEALGENIISLVTRHVTGDFGDLCEEDIKLNNEAIANKNDSILSAYNVNGEKFYVITEWDRSVTTVLLTSEY